MTDSQVYQECRLCPRQCAVDRTNGIGLCGVPASLMVSKAMLHYWEEPCLSGKNGSGAVFFSGCGLGCVFCQNRDISEGKSGLFITEERLTDIFLELEQKGAQNINLVTAVQYTPSVIAALDAARKKGLTVPVVYNSGGYETVETLKCYKDRVQIYLPDFKYWSADTAYRYSQAKDYPEVAKQAISEMVLQRGKPLFDEQGRMLSGVIIRLLLLPGRLLEAKTILRYLYYTYGNDVYFSLMSQYTPIKTFERYPELSGRVSPWEYRSLVDYAVSLGVTRAYTQEREAAKESFIPAFDYEGVLPDEKR